MSDAAKAARAAARRTARAAGYYVIDHRPLGWRIGIEGKPTYEHPSSLYSTTSEAWTEAARMAEKRAMGSGA